jgi:hypothetical protein
VRSAARFSPSNRIEHSDVTTIMGLLGDIKDDVHEIRRLLEDENGEEEEPEADA